MHHGTYHTSREGRCHFGVGVGDGFHHTRRGERDAMYLFACGVDSQLVVDVAGGWHHDGVARHDGCVGGGAFVVGGTALAACGQCRQRHQAGGGVKSLSECDGHSGVATGCRWDLFHAYDACHHELAVAAPREGPHVAHPFELDVFAGAAHQRVCHFLVGDGELELVGVQSVDVDGLRLEAALYHLALVGLEYHAFVLEVVDVAGVDACAVDEEEVEIDECRQAQHHHGHDDGDDFCFFR